MPAATTVKQRKIAPYGAMGIMYPGKVDEHIQQCNYSPAGQHNTSQADDFSIDIITEGHRFRCNLCNQHLILSSISNHIFGQRHYRKWQLHQQSMPSRSEKTSDVLKGQDRPYDRPIRFTGSNGKPGPAMASKPLPLPPKLPANPRPIQPAIPKPPSPPPLTNEQKLDNLDHFIFDYSTPREIPIEFLTARRMLIQSM
jgi:hypothetical protein